jgi:hypothetical protein
MQTRNRAVVKGRRQKQSSKCFSRRQKHKATLDTVYKMLCMLPWEVYWCKRLRYFHFRELHVAQSVQRLATGWTVRESIPGGGEIFHTRPDWAWEPLSFPHNGYWVSFPVVKRPGREVNRPSAEAEERVELFLYSPSGPSWPVLGRTSPYLLHVRKSRGIAHKALCNYYKTIITDQFIVDNLQ